jgi:hypothetical protein
MFASSLARCERAIALYDRYCCDPIGTWAIRRIAQYGLAREAVFIRRITLTCPRIHRRSEICARCSISDAEP